MKELDITINKNKILEIGFQNSNKNSFSPQTCSDLLTQIKKNINSISAVYFYSKNPGVFCVGGDLKYYSQLVEAKPGIDANKKITEQLNELNELKVPTVVAVDGLCIGGGIELLSCFDYVLSSPRALFALWQRKIGLSFGWGGAKRLSQKLHIADLKKLFLTTELITCYHAQRINLIDQVVPSYKLKQVGLAWLEKQSNLPVLTVDQIKQQGYIDSEQESFENLWLQQEHKMALNKFNK